MKLISILGFAYHGACCFCQHKTLVVGMGKYLALLREPLAQPSSERNRESLLGGGTSTRKSHVTYLPQEITPAFEVSNALEPVLSTL